MTLWPDSVIFAQLLLVLSLVLSSHTRAAKALGWSMFKRDRNGGSSLKNLYGRAQDGPKVFPLLTSHEATFNFQTSFRDVVTTCRCCKASNDHGDERSDKKSGLSSAAAAK